MRSLPTELVDHCLLHVRYGWEDDIPYRSTTDGDLKSCSLVCRSWRTLAQAYLFHDFFYPFTKAENHDSMRVETSYGELASAVDPPPTLEALRVFLCAHPHLASRIRIMHLQSDSRELDFETSLPDHSVDQSLFATLLSLLPRLQQLFLCNVVLEATRPADELHMLPSLQALTLHYGEEYDYVAAEDLQKIVASFAQIDKLALATSSYIQTIQAPENELSPLPRPVNVQHIVLPELGRVSAPLLVDVLSRTVQMPQLRRLDIPSESADYQGIVNALSHGLEELHLNLEPFYVDFWERGPDDIGLDIGSCQMLQKLYIAFSIGGHSVTDCWRFHVQNICAFIRQAGFSAHAFPHLRTFVIRLGVSDTESSRVPQPALAKPLDEAFASLVRETTLHSVTFEWVRGGESWERLEDDAFADYIYKTFPVLRSKNAVFIQAPTGEEGGSSV
ncbi:hypothetical protein PsYK624_005410 [Phanerochaete sordida]|uniref:F-box domain-containing protein n=1 Tax=Phanerochaete sordida TaxID=48140 RepID=A0A9P3FYC7_9APHY|nr:hypothetical protein PsYK624_005410 [Phanerochaete sordida]